jgi:hypothetical protein
MGLHPLGEQSWNQVERRARVTDICFDYTKLDPVKAVWIVKQNEEGLLTNRVVVERMEVFTTRAKKL